MIALASRASRIALVEVRWFARVFARVGHYMNMLAEGLIEGQEMARVARKRYPFCDW